MGRGTRRRPPQLRIPRGANYGSAARTAADATPASAEHACPSRSTPREGGRAMPVGAQPVQPPYVGPPFDEARVHDAMRVGVVTCRPTTTLADAAKMMIGYGIHSVVVSDPDVPDRPWGIVSALDIARATAEGNLGATAGEVAVEDLLSIPADASLRRAAQLMAGRGVSHLIATSPDTGHPVGVVSALGLAAAAAQER